MYILWKIYTLFMYSYFWQLLFLISKYSLLAYRRGPASAIPATPAARWFELQHWAILTTGGVSHRAQCAPFPPS